MAAIYYNEKTDNVILEFERCVLAVCGWYSCKKLIVKRYNLGNIQVSDEDYNDITVLTVCNVLLLALSDLCGIIM